MFELVQKRELKQRVEVPLKLYNFVAVCLHAVEQTRIVRLLKLISRRIKDYNF